MFEPPTGAKKNDKIMSDKEVERLYNLLDKLTSMISELTGAVAQSTEIMNELLIKYNELSDNK